jgi:signal transduction histidine kinase/streptogramin lyase
MVSYNTKTKQYAAYRTPKPMPQGFLLNRMIRFGQDYLLTATPAGLTAFNLRSKTFDIYPADRINKSTPPDFASVALDPFGNIWASSTSAGLFKFEKKPRFNSLTPTFPKLRAIPPGWISRMEEAKDGQIWFTSNGDGNRTSLNRFNPATGDIKNFIFLGLSPQLLNVASLKLMPDGRVLLSTNRGLELFHPDKNSFEPYTLPGYSSPSVVSQFFTDSRNNEWLATYGGLFMKAPGDNSFRKISIRNLPGTNESSDETTFLFESKKRGLWILSNNGLFLYRYDKGTVERHGYDRAKGDIFLTQDFNSIYEDSSGTVWVGTWQGGLCRYNPESGRIKTYSFNEGLPSMSIQGILGDEKNGNLWLSTFDGLCRFNIPTERSNNYSIDDGIQGLLYADGGILKTRSGQYYFGGSNGLTYFRPDDITQQSAPPLVYLTAIKLFNKPLQPDSNGIMKQAVYDTKEITLPYNQNNISLEFIALHYGDPSKNRYAYQLENYDPEWREVTGQREAFYPKLPPGKYVFRVKAANNNGIWNEEGIRLAITVLPPWWQTPWAYALYVLAAIGLVFLVNQMMRRRLLAKEREKQREREREHAREIETAYHKLEESHETLKTTQAQLIQSEKMASLGELTAGIAHEIQNPLNFVNNFAELNQELLQEMQEELAAGRNADAATIAGDVIANEAKIAEHGKRADAIVKNMLLHSRAAAGEKEPTNLNALADEYLHLAYHGLRAKDKAFNAALETTFDPQQPQVPVVAQDIGRVLLNLFNNAFYAVREKQKTAGSGYQPTVTLTTKKLEDTVEIMITDNGTGIPAAVRDKIFQPFFTTKPAGQGTGLGLSLGYDIVKAHGGEIHIDTKEGEYTRFTVRLPA